MTANNFHSHFGVYAAIFRNNQQELLVIKKARGPYTGRWDLPGGSPEIDELLEQTLVREIKEETGCSLTSCQQIGARSALFAYNEDGKQKTLRHLGALYKAEIQGEPMTTPDGEDADGCVWLNINEINTHNATPFVLEVCNKNT